MLLKGCDQMWGGFDLNTKRLSSGSTAGRRKRSALEAAQRRVFCNRGRPANEDAKPSTCRLAEADRFRRMRTTTGWMSNCARCHIGCSQAAPTSTGVCRERTRPHSRWLHATASSGIPNDFLQARASALRPPFRASLSQANLTVRDFLCNYGCERRCCQSAFQGQLEAHWVHRIVLIVQNWAALALGDL